MKIKVLLGILLLCSAVLVACGGNDDNGTDNTPTPGVTTNPDSGTPSPGVTTNPDSGTPTTGATDNNTDATSSASIVSDANAFVNAIGKDGTWIIALLNDLSIEQDLVLEGEFTNGKKDDAGKDIIQRKIALYTQDENRNITSRFNLTSPSLTINSPEATIQHGNFIGELFINTTNFKLVDVTVDGNVYFKDKEVQDSFTMDETSRILGNKEVKAQ